MSPIAVYNIYEESILIKFHIQSQSIPSVALLLLLVCPFLFDKVGGLNEAVLRYSLPNTFVSRVTTELDVSCIFALDNVLSLAKENKAVVGESNEEVVVF